MKDRDPLRVLQDSVHERVSALTGVHPDWPCRKGCDDCCRSLASVPLVTAPEWKAIAAALDQMPPEQRKMLRERIRGAAGAQRPVTCPLLDRETGSCSIYDVRPVACRTYGFYADRVAVLGCHRIEALFEGKADIVWGNQIAVESALDQLGPALPLDAWLDPPTSSA